MLLWLQLLVLMLPSSAPFALPEDKLEVTELNGGSVMTDFPAASEIAQPPLTWFVINDQSCPIRLEGMGMSVNEQDGNYSYATRGIATASSGISEMEVQFMLFDVQGTNMKSLSQTKRLK